MSRLVDADVVIARLQDEADIVLNAADRCPLGSDERRSLIAKGSAYGHAIQIVKDATREGAPVEASTGEARSAVAPSGLSFGGGILGAFDVEGAPATFSPIHPEPSHGVGPHNGGVGVAVSESASSDTASSPAAALDPSGALEGVGAPASPDPTDFLEAQEVVSGALLKAHRLAVWRDEALPMLSQWLDLAHDARDAGLIHVPYGQSVTQAFARWARQHIDHEGDQP